MIVLAGSAALVVAAIALLGTGEAWLLVPVLLLLGVATVFVVRYAQARAGEGDKPDPVTEARIDEQG